MNSALLHARPLALAWLTLAVAACSADSPLTAPESTLTASVASVADAAPTLLYCPSTESRSVTKRIGPKGGTLTVAGTRMVVPGGAVPVETEFTLTIPASDWLELDIVAVGREHYQFSQPVELTVSYARCRTPAAESEALSAWHLDAATRDFLQHMGGLDIKQGRRIVFETDHLSKYAIAW